MVMAYKQELEDHSNGRREEAERTLRRPRSPSPFIASSRSRSTQRRDSTGQPRHQQSSNNQSNGLPQQQADPLMANGHTSTSSEHHKTRRKNGVYTGQQKVKRRTPDPTQVTPYREQRDATSSRLSQNASELPPIRSGSAASASGRRSSRDSRESGANQTKPVPMIRLGDKPLISIDSRTSDLTTSSPRNPPPKRSYVSPGSGSGSQEAAGSSNKSQMSSSGTGPTLLRNKTTYPESEANPGPKLETLFERNGTSIPLTSRRVVEDVKPDVQMRRNTHSFSSIISLQTSNLTANKRTKSQTNLSKLSENGQSNMMAEKRPLMSRYRSDTNLNIHTSSNNPAQLGSTSRLNRAVTSIKPVRKTRVNGQTKPAKQRPDAAQQPLQQPQQQMQQQEQTLNAQNLRLQAESGDDPDSGEDFERIHEWLDGVDSAQVEHPPNQDIQDEGPPQTDTAIHIVYDGD